LLVTERPSLLFVSTRFLFPADSGGKIRTGQILRGLKGGHFKIRLVMPCSDAERVRFAEDIDLVCDELAEFADHGRGKVSALALRVSSVLKRRPIPVEVDVNESARAVVRRELARQPSLVVFDFPHSAVLAPDVIDCPSVMFTHNIEAEIFRRHLEVAGSPVHRWLWKNQYRKMLAFEKHALRSFDSVIAVSERDCQFFKEEYGTRHCQSIPTGVDTDLFGYCEPNDDCQVVFCGSMDWMANIDGIEFFHDHVWPLVRRQNPDARMKVVGRSPPQSMLRRISNASPDWEFTGFVDDVRDHVAGSAVFVIPLRVGGGTRIKAFEAMAMGCPVVSTAIGVEGLPVEDGVHFRRGDSAEELADRIVTLLADADERRRLSRAARDLVVEQFGYRKAALKFEEICRDTVSRRVSG
jgi:glycosyltransferase involved in cell wall biosynthesis